MNYLPKAIICVGYVFPTSLIVVAYVFKGNDFINYWFSYSSSIDSAISPKIVFYSFNLSFISSSIVFLSSFKLIDLLDE